MGMGFRLPGKGQGHFLWEWNGTGVKLHYRGMLYLGVVSGTIDAEQPRTHFPSPLLRARSRELEAHPAYLLHHN